MVAKGKFNTQGRKNLGRWFSLNEKSRISHIDGFYYFLFWVGDSRILEYFSGVFLNFWKKKTKIATTLLLYRFVATKKLTRKKRRFHAVQSEGPIDDNLIWGNCDLYQTFCVVKKKIFDHIHLFVSAKGRKLYGSKCFFHLPARINRGQSWVVVNLAGLVWWKIKTYQLERTSSAAEQWANSVFIRVSRDFIRFHLH